MQRKHRTTELPKQEKCKVYMKVFVTRLWITELSLLSQS